MIVLGSLVMALGFIVYYGMTTSYMGIHFELARAPEGRRLPRAAASAGYVDLILVQRRHARRRDRRGLGREPLGRDRRARRAGAPDGARDAAVRRRRRTI